MTEPTDSIKNVKIKFQTTLGDFTVQLYDDTPLHRDNMVKLVNEHFYDGLLFHRIIKDFMVQGGDPDSKDAVPGQMLGSGDPGYTIPAEIRPNHFHTRYALAAARTGDQVNPERRSSGSQFYVVTGNQVDSTQLAAMAEQRVFNDLVQQNVDRIRQMQASGDMAGLQALQTEFEAKAKAEASAAIPAEVAKAYATVGGAPFLDGQYTVYGEVVDGFETIDAIEGVKTGAADRPVEDVRIISASVVE
ncbi:MAG: peptidylprolyl isomerase [Muribaculaceae bacterium]|nr:peptidylprolyl isomerase [Muribaculaceae bacterium]